MTLTLANSKQSDFNTAGFTYKTSQLNTIDFHSTHVTVRYSEYPGVHMRGVLRKLIDQIDVSKLSAVAGPKMVNKVEENKDSSDTITQAWIWPRVGQFLKQNDIVITETGTANFGIWETKFPKGVSAISQVLWGSIGYSGQHISFPIPSVFGTPSSAEVSRNERSIYPYGPLGH